MCEKYRTLSVFNAQRRYVQGKKLIAIKGLRVPTATESHSAPCHTDMEELLSAPPPCLYRWRDHSHASAATDTVVPHRVGLFFACTLQPFSSIVICARRRPPIAPPYQPRHTCKICAGCALGAGPKSHALKRPFCLQKSFITSLAACWFA